MNKFEVIKCIDVDDDDYKGCCVVMACCSDPSFVLFFPVNKENSKIINYVLEDDSKYDINTNVLGIYKTMIDSWHSADRFLIGIIMDSVYNTEAKEDVLMIRLVLADQNGIDSLVHVNFIHAVLLAAMEGTNLILSDELLSKMVPDMENEQERPNPVSSPHFPEDKKIVDIAKKIMNGKIKDT